MVIQRWQTVFLILAVICMALASFLSLGNGTLPCLDQGSLCALDFMPLFIVNMLVIALLFTDIFLFRNLGLQKKVALISILLESISIIITGILMIPSMDYIHEMSWTATLPAVALILTILARSRMAADERLLKSYDRIR